MDLSIIIPAYNEEKRIIPTLQKIRTYLSQQTYTHEVIVVDDGSLDETYRVVEVFKRSYPNLVLLKNQMNEGKGSAVKKGILSARGDLIFFTDADLSTPIEELEKFLKEIKNVDIVIGSRSIKGANVRAHEPFYRERLGKFFNFNLRHFLLPQLPDFIDTQCGAKMYRREAALKIFPLQKIEGFAFDVEILYIAKKMGYKILEMPVTWDYSADTRVRTFKDGLAMALDVLRISSLHKNLEHGN